MRTLASFANVHPGATMVVCGCGESLCDFNAQGEFITIGVNDVGRMFQPDYLVVVNPREQFSGDRFSWVESSRAKHLFTHLDLAIPHPCVVRFTLGQFEGTDFSNPDVLHYAQNSPYVALCLACHMGAKRIGLVGVDFTDNHFFGVTGPHVLTPQLSSINEQYRRLGEALRSRGIEVVNLSRKSRLTAFPKVRIEDFRGARPVEAVRAKKRVFFVNYQFLSAGDVFSQGLRRAAVSLRLETADALWDDSQLAEKVARFDPDLLFVVHGRRFAERAGVLLRGYRSAVWLVDEPYEVDDTSAWSGMFDSVFVNDPATLSRHRNASFLPVAYDPGLHFPDDRVRDLAVGFVGGYNSVRERALVSLAEAGRLSYVVGGPWHSPLLQRLSLGVNLPPEQVAELYRRTRIVVNVFRETHHFNQQGIAPVSLNPRVYEALACGALVVSERRPEVSLFPSLPTFTNAGELLQLVTELADNPARTKALLDPCRAALAGHSYADRLAKVLDLTPGPFKAIPAEVPVLPSGWLPVGGGVTSSVGDEITVVAGESEERGIVTEESFGGVRLSFDLRVDARCRFIAKVHQISRGDRSANSYHLLICSGRITVARHNRVLASAASSAREWQGIELQWLSGTLAVSIDGREVCRCVDAMLDHGFCAIGATCGTASVRRLRAETLDQSADSAVATPAGWRATGRGGGVEVSGEDAWLLNAGEKPGKQVWPPSNTITMFRSFFTRCS